MRCKRSNQKGQCDREAVDGKDYCARHVKGRNYVLTNPVLRDSVERQQKEARLDCLEEEIRIARALIENRLNLATSPEDLVAAAPAVQGLLGTIDKLLIDRQKMQLAVGELLAKTAILALAGNIVEVLSAQLENIPQRDVIIDTVVEQITHLIEEQENEVSAVE